MSETSQGIMISAKAAPLSFRRAEAADVDAIVRLVNAAYRGDSSRAGWTTEADLLGGQRTDAGEVRELIETDDSLILLGYQGPDLAGSLHLKREGGSAYLGMFAIQPTLQGAGLGKRFIDEAERIAREEWQVQTMRMSVIGFRQELIAYYERRGYRRTGELLPFPIDPRFGIPRVEGLQLEVLEKRLGA
ncbi:GNAT family N-acetyltransferase [Thermithiobacillus plumbiphilus]|uniref:GNAT family N-acetyltransferase n=1 Tax=Thermithiobacillus plumbiphilus TaxID=1729899 RepID=A0ABU9DB51_9PROT